MQTATQSPLAFCKKPSDKLPNIIKGKDEFTGWHWKDARCTWYLGLHSDETGMSRPDDLTANLTAVRDALVASGKLKIEGIPSIDAKWNALNHPKSNPSPVEAPKPASAPVVAPQPPESKPGASAQAE